MKIIKFQNKYDGEMEALSIDDFEIKDSMEDKHLIAFKNVILQFVFLQKFQGT